MFRLVLAMEPAHLGNDFSTKSDDLADLIGASTPSKDSDSDAGDLADLASISSGRTCGKSGVRKHDTLWDLARPSTSPSNCLMVAPLKDDTCR